MNAQAELRAALAKAISGEARFERLDRALYSTDASVYQIVPVGAVLPKTEDDVRATVAACRHLSVPITARGGGTSQAGQSIGAGVILDFSKHFHDVLEINAAERWVRVRPGCVLDDLNHAVRPAGLQFAPDISTANRATIGGMIANNSSGTHSLIYGKTIDHVLELRVLLADGSIIQARPLDPLEFEKKTQQQDLEGACYRVTSKLATEHAREIDHRFPKILRRVGGYNLDRFVPQTGASFNLAELFVGSEGTLGIVLEAKLRLIELPKAKAVLVVEFADLLEALAVVPVILAHQPAAVEVMDRMILDATKLNADAARLRSFLQGDPGAILVIEFYADKAEFLPGRLDALERDLEGVGYGRYRATELAAQARIWKLRTLALGLSMAEKGDAKAISFVEDTAVAPEKLRDYIAEFLAVVKRHGTRAGVYAHASVGCLHVRPVVDLKTVEGVRQFEAIAGDVADLVLKYGGALSGEHGDGLVRSPFQKKMFGPVLYEAFRTLKRTFDPTNLLNPGKIVDAPPLTASLRYGPAYRTPEVQTTFDFSTDGGIVRSVELCAGVGECRKRRGGTMCPSYQATREEQHSTRGRANTLRLALTGQLELTGLTDPAVRAALDLCLECKACKSECPTNVDMARLKAEALHQYHEKHGLPHRNRFFGRVARVSKWGCRLAPLSNWWAGSRLGRWLNEMLLGIDRRRLPPRFAGRPFVAKIADDWLTRRDKPPVLLFPDTFTNYHEPHIGLAALALLGLENRVLVPGAAPAGMASFPSAPALALHCCGRPMISNGMLREAVVNATYNVEQLYPWAAEGNAIVACEPSCILTIKDDYPALLPGELGRKARVVAGQCFTLEEHLEKAEPNLRLKPGPAKILLQGHCHQRSLVGMEPALRLLRRIPGAEVVDLDAGCCGLAGSFGYEVEHYEISRLVGEQRLFPMLRQAGPETVIVAPGFSCRLQIEHFTGRKALHPAALLASLLVSDRV
jgi:FAD/FMN-containing dehydrogenase/Fe-S oxidoreductase